jgi:hypothetical protein
MSTASLGGRQLTIIGGLHSEQQDTAGAGRSSVPFALTSTYRQRSGVMHNSKRWMVSGVAIAAAWVAAGPLAAADEVPMTKEMKLIVDFQCHGAKTVKQAESNLANMERSYSDQHPVVICLKKKIVELKAAGEKAGEKPKQVAQQR